MPGDEEDHNGDPGVAPLQRTGERYVFVVASEAVASILS
jgi:hypothetical protein